MQSVQRERSERESKRKIADAREPKEAKMFIAGVESGRIADGMAKKNEEKMKRRLEAAGEAAGDGAAPQKSFSGFKLIGLLIAAILGIMFPPLGIVMLIAAFRKGWSQKG